MQTHEPARGQPNTWSDLSLSLEVFTEAMKFNIVRI